MKAGIKGHISAEEEDEEDDDEVVVLNIGLTGIAEIYGQLKTLAVQGASRVVQH